MTTTKTVRTYELRVANPKTPEKWVPWATGTVRDLVEHAASLLYRIHRNAGRDIAECVLDNFESTLRLNKHAELLGYKTSIVPITEEYEKDEEE